MTVPATDRRAGPFPGTGAITALPFTFKVFEAADLVVTKADSDGNTTTLELTTDYTVSLNGDQDSSPGGTVTPVTAPAVGESVTLTSGLSYEQTLDLLTGGNFSPRAIEDALDRTVIQIQQVVETVDRAIVFSPTDTEGSELPPASVRADKLLGFNSLGQLVVLAPADGSAASLATDLANSSSATRGAGQVGFDPSQVYNTPATVGWWLRNLNRSVLEFIPSSLWAGILAQTNTTDLAPYLQAAYDAIEASGGRLNFHGLLYRCDTALDWRRASTATVTQYRYMLNGEGAILDFRNSALTSGSCIRVGATAQANTNECGKIVVQDFIVLGPDSASITANNARGGTTVGWEFSYCLNLVLKNLHTQWFFKGYKFNFCFPIDATSVISQTCCIGAHLGSDLTLASWKDCGFRNGRFGLLIQPDGTSGSVYGQRFQSLNLEGNYVGAVLDPLSGTGVGIRNIKFDSPYVEAVTYDGFRLQTAFDSSNAATVGADQTRDITGLDWDGGTWEAGGTAWGASGHDAILGPSSGTTKPYSLRINIPVGEDGMSVGNCRDVEFRGFKDYATGATADNFQALAGESVVRFDANDAGGTGAVTIRVAKNVTGVSKTSSNGEFEITFGRDYKSSTSYAVAIACHGAKRYGEVYSTAAGSCVIRTYDDTGTLADPTGDVSVIVKGIE